MIVARGRVNVRSEVLFCPRITCCVKTVVIQKKPAPDKTKGLRLLKETPQASLVQKKPAPKPVPDKVENLAKEYLDELKEVDVTFEKGTAVLEKYRAKYPELASYIREIVPGERRMEQGNAWKARISTCISSPFVFWRMRRGMK